MRRLILLSPVWLLAVIPQSTFGDLPDPLDIDRFTWVDHDKRPIPEPPEWEPNYYAHMFRQSIAEPLSHAFDIPDKLISLFGERPIQEAVNVNAFDEVPNSSWFTNRNHLKPIPPAELRRGPYEVLLPKKPWVIKHAKESGVTAGFQIEDANGKRWFIKLDPKNHPQLISGADMVTRTLIYAAGYNVPNNQPVRFHKGDLTIDEDLLKGTEGERMTRSDLEEVLDRGARFPDGSYSALASLFIPGEVLGAPSMKERRPGDTNDIYTHNHRRELRGLYVMASWLGSWDTKDHNFLDVFTVTTPDSLGHVDHYVLDVGASLGASGFGAREPWQGYEATIDWGWMFKRLVTLGFVEEPWRNANGDVGIPSVGNFESKAYEPDEFKTLQEQPAFRAMSDRDGYWGAKIVASFSQAQIEAAVDAAGYEDPRAKPYLVKTLMERRDKVVRYWFREVAPLDFFEVDQGVLRFRDLAQDIGIAGARAYRVEIESHGEGPDIDKTVRILKPELPLEALNTEAQRLDLVLSVVGSKAKPVVVELVRDSGKGWVVTWVRHA